MIFRDEFVVVGTGETDATDVTERVAAIVARSGMQDGTCLVFVPGSTAAVTTIEFEPGVVEDLKRAIERFAPRDGRYAHDAAWGDGNGYAHVRAAMLGPSLAVPVVAGKPLLGTWQQIVVLDFDNRPRRRRVVVQVQGG
jgi:secondary thiamine-phosphate synthase enzyme